MFNNNQSIKINAVSGTLVKNYKDSFILHFHVNSQLAHKVLAKDPMLWHPKDPSDKNRPVVVLQTMLCGDGELLAEIMWKEDFDKIFGPQTESEDKE